MRLLCTFLSIVYIAMIFLWADSPVVSDLAPFNPYSLLHTPLYGILTLLLIFSFFPFNFKTNVPNVLNDLNLPCLPCSQSVQGEMQSLFHRGEHNASTHSRINTSSRLRFLISGIIALGVAIADEIHQSFIPTRDASILDVFLDFVGIALTLFLLSQLHKKRKTKKPLYRIYT